MSTTTTLTTQTKQRVKENVQAILKEIQTVFEKLNEDQINQWEEEIRGAKTIVVAGAGRVGMAIRGFGMRLGHLGFHAFTLGDSTVPSIGSGDLFLVSSGSGETQTIYDLVVIAKKNGARVALVTGNPASRMGQLADAIVHLEAPSKTKTVEGLVSAQPMTTLNEQCLGIFFDAVVLKLMEGMNETHETMWQRHSNLE